MIRRSICLILVCSAGVARAEPNHEVTASISFAHGSIGASSTNAFEVDAAALIGFGAFAIGAELGAVLGSAGALSSPLKPLNPFLAGYYFVELEAAKLRVGAGIGLPLLTRTIDPEFGDDELGEGAAYATAGIGHGLWNRWLYRPKTTAFVIPVRLSIAPFGLVGIGGEGALALVHQAPNETRDPGTLATSRIDFTYQLAAEGYLALAVEPGLRVQWVQTPTAFDADVRLSLVPFVRIDAGPIAVEASFTYTAGFSSARGRVIDGSGPLPAEPKAFAFTAAATLAL